MTAPLTDNPIEAQLLADLDEVAAWFVERLKDADPLHQFTTNELRRAGELGYICDLLASLGHDRSELSEKHGWGRIVEATKS